MPFHKILYQLRKQRNVSQETVAKALCVTRRTISAWEAGRKLPSFDSLAALSCYYGVSADYLLGITDTPNKSAAIR